MEDQTGILAMLIEDCDLKEKKNEQARLDYNLCFKPNRESEMHIVQLSPIPEDIFHLLQFHLNLSYDLHPEFLTR